MKIEWIHTEEREVPKVGLMTTGTIRDVDREIGEALIKQGLARKKVQGSKVQRAAQALAPREVQRSQNPEP